MIQPEVARPYLADDLLQQQGFLSRFLVCAPASTMGTRFFQEPNPDSLATLARWHQFMLSILQTTLPMADGQRNELEPRALHLSPAAKDLWRAFHDECEVKLGSGGDYAEFRGFANKLPEHALRLAGVLTLVGDVLAQVIEVEAMRNGITLARYYAAEALRLSESRLTDTNTMHAETVRLWLIKSWGFEAISIPDLQRSGPRAVRRGGAEQCNKVVAILAQHGWLKPLDGGTTINGKRREKAWQVIRPLSPLARNRQGKDLE